jgi:trehalose utilization protein
MALYQITSAQLPQVWGTVAPMLQRAIDLDPTEITIEQVEYSVRTGRTHLLIWDEPGEGITGAVTVDIIDYPRQRVAHVNLMGGKGIVRHHVFDEAKNWMRLMGATTAQCWAKGSLVQMYEKMGMSNTHQVMRIGL